MITINKIKLWALTLSMMVSASACSDWLAVDMEDSILEDKLYETNDGFLYSLNGIYTKMNENYASTLSMGPIDVMAQYYDISKNNSHSYYAFATYNSEEYKNTSNALWTNQYALIANLNVLLEHCDTPDAAISKVYYPYVKGEALALRAFFHFDLLRIYGPIYSESTAGQTTIPYQETSSKDIQPLLSAQTVMEKVIRDLKAASELLKDDRIRTEGVMHGESENPNETTSLRYRQYRMNYYAVQALLARAYLWMGNKQEAARVAKAFIEEEAGKEKDKKVFPWTEKAVATHPSTPDRLFSSEVIFSLYNTSRVNIYDQRFKKSTDMRSILAFQGDDLGQGNLNSKLTYFYDDMNDVRRDPMWTIEEINQTDETGGTTKTQKMACFHKYENFAGVSSRYMIPLIRLSEIYLIAAECESDPQKALDYVNAIRKVRNCVDVKLPESEVESKVKKAITDEFMREVIGEGQLFFYYKRHATPVILGGNGFSDGYWGPTIGEVTMNMKDYVWPMPEVEMDKRAQE